MPTDEALQELLEDHIVGGDIYWISPSTIGAMTDAPIISFESPANTKKVYFHERYAVEDPIAKLRDKGAVTFKGTSSEDDMVTASANKVALDALLEELINPFTTVDHRNDKEYEHPFGSKGTEVESRGGSDGAKQGKMADWTMKCPKCKGQAHKSSPQEDFRCGCGWDSKSASKVASFLRLEDMRALGRGEITATEALHGGVLCVGGVPLTEWIKHEKNASRIGVGSARDKAMLVLDMVEPILDKYAPMYGTNDTAVRDNIFHMCYNGFKNNRFPANCNADTLGLYDKPKKDMAGQEIAKEVLRAMGAVNEMSRKDTVKRMVNDLGPIQFTGAAKPKCPHCGSGKYSLMPTDFETAKCDKCGKNWDHGIVPGINDPKTASYDFEVGDDVVAQMPGATFEGTVAAISGDKVVIDREVGGKKITRAFEKSQVKPKSAIEEHQQQRRVEDEAEEAHKRKVVDEETAILLDRLTEMLPKHLPKRGACGPNCGECKLPREKCTCVPCHCKGASMYKELGINHLRAAADSKKLASIKTAALAYEYLATVQERVIREMHTAGYQEVGEVNEATLLNWCEARYAKTALIRMHDTPDRNERLDLRKHIDRDLNDEINESVHPDDPNRSHHGAEGDLAPNMSNDLFMDNDEQHDELHSLERKLKTLFYDDEENQKEVVYLNQDPQNGHWDMDRLWAELGKDWSEEYVAAHGPHIAAKKPVIDESALMQAANAFVQFLKNTPEGRRADAQPAEMDLPNPNWAPRAPSAHAGIRYWGNWETPRDAEGDTEDYDWQELSAESGKKLDQYQKAFKAEAQVKFPGLKFDVGGGEKNWLEITVTKA